ncbi:YHS domain-containing protein [Panacibacter ginsenosidivorans]|uniref:YHS domain-containing protein n=1 Tax=Panacibacter ginsenosidivorans TaxID=1813871 RepID=A0A5B8V5J5_9BACT|nr:YHS domain-containing (seleno)protein [Panacibacter ginsenosidivorans]QEC66083.1 YHS domain-containing protein [Panacibacter ginsenosidivorans]
MKISLVLAGALLMCSGLKAQKSPVFIEGKTAINGYDAVAYFSEHMPVKGDKKFSYEWNGADWYFSKQSNLDSFKISPQKYAPQFGGYCAYGMAQGHKAPTDPMAWAIVNNKLYLNYNKDVQGLWKQKQDEYIQTAEKNWPKLKDKE